MTVTGHLLCPLFAKAFSLEITPIVKLYFFEGYCIYIYNFNDYDFNFYCQYYIIEYIYIHNIILYIYHYITCKSKGVKKNHAGSNMSFVESLAVLCL